MCICTAPCCLIPRTDLLLSHAGSLHWTSWNAPAAELACWQCSLWAPADAVPAATPLTTLKTFIVYILIIQGRCVFPNWFPTNCLRVNSSPRAKVSFTLVKGLLHRASGFGLEYVSSRLCWEHSTSDVVESFAQVLGAALGRTCEDQKRRQSYSLAVSSLPQKSWQAHPGLMALMCSSWSSGPGCSGFRPSSQRESFFPRPASHCRVACFPPEKPHM